MKGLFNCDCMVYKETIDRGSQTRVCDYAMKGFLQLARVSTYQLKFNALAKVQHTSSKGKRKKKKKEKNEMDTSG